MNNHAEEFRELAMINNSIKGCGFTDSSNVQSGATRLFNSGSELLNNYISIIEDNAYNNGYQNAMSSFPIFDIKSAIIGGVIVASVIIIPSFVSKVRRSYKAHKTTTEYISSNPNTGYEKS